MQQGNSLLQRALYFLRRRQRAYIELFPTKGQNTQIVLADLARFCRARQTTGHKDPYIAARLDGRREVFLRIQHHLRLDDAALWQLYDGRPHPENTNNGE